MIVIRTNRSDTRENQGISVGEACGGVGIASGCEKKARVVLSCLLSI